MAPAIKSKVRVHTEQKAGQSTSAVARARTDPQFLPPGLVIVEDGVVRGEVQRSGGRTPALCAQDFLNLRLVSL